MTAKYIKKSDALKRHQILKYELTYYKFKE